MAFKRGSMSTGRQVAFGPLVTEPVIMATAFVVILAAGVLLTAAPRLTNQVFDQGLKTTMEEARTVDRNIEVRGEDRFEQGLDSLMPQLSERFRDEQMSPLVNEMFPDEGWMVSTGDHTVMGRPDAGLDRDLIDWAFADWPQVPNNVGIYLRLRNADRIEAATTIVEGREPQLRHPESAWYGSDCSDDLHEPGTPGLPTTIFDENQQVICEVIDYRVVEALFGAGTLDTFGLEVGDQIRIRYPVPVAVEIVGIIEMNDPEDDYWMGDTWVEKPELNMVFTPSGLEIQDAWLTGVFNREVYAQLLGIWDGPEDSFVYTLRYYVDIDRVTPERATEATPDLRTLQRTRFPEPFQTFRVSSQVPRLVETFTGQMQKVLSTLATVLAGVGVSAAAVVGMLAYMIENRQRSATVLVRNRGGSRAQLTVSQLVRGLALAIPAMALAYLIALLLTTYDSGASRLYAFGMVLAAPLVFVAAGYPVTHADLGTLQRTGDVQRGLTSKRGVAELMVIVVAVAAVLLVRRRGATEGQVDLMLASVPFLLALAAGILMFRLVVIPLGVASWLTNRTRGITGFIGFRRLRQQVPLIRVPMLVVVLTAATLIFAFMMRASIHDSDEVASYRSVGADFLITAAVPGNRLPEGIDFAEVEGVEATASAYYISGASGCMADRQFCDFIDVLVVDGPAYQEVLGQTAGDPQLPGFIIRPQFTGGLGTEANPIPALVSSGWQQSGPPTPGRIFNARVSGTVVWFVISEVRNQFPGLDPSRPFIVADSSLVEAAGVNVPFNTNRLYLRAPETGAVSEEAERWAATVTSRHEIHREMRTSLLARTVEQGLWAALLVLGVFTILAIVGLAVFSELPRLRDLGLLRTLGLSGRQARRVGAIEVLLTTTLSALVGALVGTLALRLLADVMDLDLTRSGVGPILVLAAASGLTAVFVLFSGFGKTRDLTRILKVGDE